MGATAATPGIPSAAGRIPELDGLRGLAIVLVLFDHFVVHSSMTGYTFADVGLYRLAASSWIGVDLFFVLSGFLITGILFDARRNEGYFRNFYSRRVLRIFPLYFGFLALSLMTAPALLSADASGKLIDNQIWFWTYLSNFYIVADNGWPAPPHLNHFWSLAIEEQFYLLWPLAVLAFSRQQLLRLTAACMVVALALRIMSPFGMSPLDGYVLLPTRMDSLAAGAFIALLARSDNGAKLLRDWSVPCFGISAIVIFALFQRKWTLNELDTLVRTFGYTFIAVAGASLVGALITARENSWLRRIFSMNWLMKMGMYSYGLYVLHHPIVFLLRDIGFDAQSFPRFENSALPGVLAFAVVAFCLSIGFAMLSYHYWELPFLKLKQFFPYSGRPRRAETMTGTRIEKPLY